MNSWRKIHIYFWYFSNALFQMLDYYMSSSPKGISFDEFMKKNPQLMEGGLFLQYYKKETMLNNPTARKEFVLPGIHLFLFFVLVLFWFSLFRFRFLIFDFRFFAFSIIACWLYGFYRFIDFVLFLSFYRFRFIASLYRFRFIAVSL